MPPPHQGNQGVGLFGADQNQETLSIAFGGANIWTAGETEQHQHELQIINIRVTTKTGYRNKEMIVFMVTRLKT